MKEIDALKDLLQSRISNQIYYNENLINIQNPEIRQVFTQMRDDEMQSIIKLQQRVSRLETPGGTTLKIFPSKPN